MSAKIPLPSQYFVFAHNCDQQDPASSCSGVFATLEEARARGDELCLEDGYPIDHQALIAILKDGELQTIEIQIPPNSERYCGQDGWQPA